MSGFPRDVAGPEHEQARALAAARPDGFLDAAETQWLDTHLAGCQPCAAVAAEYLAQDDLFAPARAALPQAPRDLWARTAATIESERRHGGRRVTPRFGRRLYAPLVGALAVAVVVGASVLDGLPAKESTSKGDEPDSSPIALAVGEIRVLSPGENGTLELRRRVVDEVCPVGADSCGLNPTTEVTQTERLASAATSDAYISPARDQFVVVQREGSDQGVYVVNVRDGDATASPSPAATPSPTEPATPEPTEVASVSPEPSDVASVEPSAAPSSHPSPAGSPAVESGSPTASDPPADPASPTPTITPEPATPEPTPSVEATPRRDGAIEIAPDVILVGGTASYSPDGTLFAFSARPADGTAGSDVFVWTVGESRAVAVTADGSSLFTGWLGDELLVSRVVEGTARTIALGVTTGTQRSVNDGPMWRPAVDPNGKRAAWWDGSVKRAQDDLTWLPDTGRLLLGPWPGRDADAQVLAETGLTDWQVGWDESGTLIAVWTSTAAPGEPGTLGMYAVDPATGLADLASPKLAPEPAYEGFSMATGRLTWSAPAAGGDTSVQVLAWEGETFGRLEILSEGGTRVVR